MGQDSAAPYAICVFDQHTGIWALAVSECAGAERVKPIEINQDVKVFVDLGHFDSEKMWQTCMLLRSNLTDLVLLVLSCEQGIRPEIGKKSCKALRIWGLIVGLIETVDGDVSGS